MKLKLQFVIFSLLCCLNINAQPLSNYICKSLNVNDGLSQNDVRDIIQDKYGYIWIATDNGICRYDGYDFVSFNIGYNGLNSNTIQCLKEDLHGNIWVGTNNGGFYYYLRDKNKFYHQSELTDESWANDVVNVKYIEIDGDGRLWISDTFNQHIISFEFDYENLSINNGTIHNYFSTDFKKVVTDLEFIEGKLYLATNRGLMFYSPIHSSFRDVDENVFFGYVNSVTQNNTHIFVTFLNKIITININTGETITHNIGIQSNRLCATDSLLWISNSKGIYTADFSSSKREISNPQQIKAQKDIIANSTLVDKNGGVWIGYFKEGLQRFEKNKRPFTTLKGFGNNHISQIYKHTDNNIWIGTEGSGVFVTAEDNYGEIIQNFMEGTMIYSIKRSDYNNKVYISANRGLFEITENKDGSYQSKQLMPLVTGTNEILPDGRYIWVGSFQNGLFRYDTEDDTYISLKKSNNLMSNGITAKMVDSKGNLWVCTSNGMNLINANNRLNKDRVTARRILPKRLKDHHFLSILEDSKGNIWCGTSGRGIHKLTQKNDNSGYDFKTYTTESGLPDNVVKAIIESDEGHIWFSTNKGLCCLNPETDIVRNYDLSDGIQSNEFSKSAVAKLKDGDILFGGINGINILKPGNIEKNYSISNPTITDILIFHESVTNKDDFAHIIPSLLNPELGAELKYNQNNITFLFSTDNFSNPNRSRYKYRLVGFDRDWISVPATNRQAVYTNIPHGKYSFELQSSNEDNIWSETLTYPLTINPPIWATWYAYLFYILAISGCFIILANRYNDRQKRKNDILIAKLERKRASEMLELRTRLFTNISHEFRTPLTLILSPLQQIMGDKEFIENNPQIEKHLKTMKYNGKLLLRLITELLNYTKKENGKLEVELKYEDFTVRSHKIIDQFTYITEQREITLETSIPTTPIMLHYDTNLMKQIVYNIMSNAIKHTPTGGKISYHVEDKGDSVLLYIKDTGKGIDPSLNKHLFERFYSLNASANSETGGTGIGLYLSKSLVEMHKGKIWFESAVGEGTTFFISIPKLDLESTENIVVNDVYHNEKVEQEVEKAELEAGEKLKLALNDSVDKELPTMLVIDDNVDLLQLLKDIFSPFYHVETAINGEEGIAKSLELIPDIIISDVMMPGIDGFEVCNTLKQNPNTSHIPIIMLTAKTEEKDMIDGYRSQADGYCTKPFNNTLLIEIVNSIIENRKILISKMEKIVDKSAEIINEPKETKLVEATQSIIATSETPTPPQTPTITEDEKVESDVEQVEQEEQKAEEEEIKVEPKIDTTTALDREFIKRLTDYISENIHNSELSIGDICSKMGVTQLILNKKLKSLLNTTANALVRKIRIKHAAALLRTGRYNISDVTYDVGFSDLRYFRECFKKEFGISPQAYKDKFANNPFEE